jgi:hypothetical protein
MRSPCCLCVRLCIFQFLVFYAVRFVSKESRPLILPRTSCVYYEVTLLSVCLLSLLGNSFSVCLCVPSYFIVCYAIFIMLKESRQLVLPRISCYNLGGWGGDASIAPSPYRRPCCVRSYRTNFKAQQKSCSCTLEYLGRLRDPTQVKGGPKVNTSPVWAHGRLTAHIPARNIHHLLMNRDWTYGAQREQSVDLRPG